MNVPDFGLLSPFEEPSWHVSPETLGPPPRRVQGYQPPTHAGHRRTRLLIVAVGLASIAYLVVKLVMGASLVLPIFSVVAIALCASLVLVGPQLMRTMRGASSAEQQLELARIGEAAVVVVERVDYGKRRARGAGYRDTMVAKRDEGNAYATLDVQGEAHPLVISFRPGEPSLADGDAVTVLYDPADPDQWMAVRGMEDVQFERRSR